MKPIAALLGILTAALIACTAWAQDNPCAAGAKMYDNGAMVCMRGFIQRCENGAWSNQQRFCSDDPSLEVVREPNVAVPPAGGDNQPGVPPADNPSQVVVPPPD